jgi:deoxyribodipyrimidine photo-lyase
MFSLAENIEGIQIFAGEFNELIEMHSLKSVFFKEHPLNSHYKGTEESRDWMFGVSGDFRSFFAFWKRCRKELV